MEKLSYTEATLANVKALKSDVQELKALMLTLVDRVGAIAAGDQARDKRTEQFQVDMHRKLDTLLGKPAMQAIYEPEVRPTKSRGIVSKRSKLLLERTASVFSNWRSRETRGSSRELDCDDDFDLGVYEPDTRQGNDMASRHGVNDLESENVTVHDTVSSG